jgi:hypothetical protein
LDFGEHRDNLYSEIENIRSGSISAIKKICEIIKPLLISGSEIYVVSISSLVRITYTKT